MLIRRIANIIFLLPLVLLLFVSGTGCNTTKHIKDGEYLLRSNTVTLKSTQVITQKGEIKDNLSGLIVQKTNKYWFGYIPYKLWLYNARYEKYQKDSANFQVQSKTVEPPVIYDSNLRKKSVINMKGYLFHQGYFYSEIKDTAIFKGKKAYVTYQVNTGTNYLIKDVSYDIADSAISKTVIASSGKTFLKNGDEFSYTKLEQERSRITALMLQQGYYKFSNEHVSFVIDTLNKQFLKDIENPFESAINFIALQKTQRKPTISIQTIIKTDDPSAFIKYGINRVRVFPDYEGSQDFRDTTMHEATVDGVVFRYHNKPGAKHKYYVNPKVVQKQIFLKPQTYYDQDNYDQTISRLNELGVFQSVRIVFREDTSRGPGWLNCTILLSPAEKLAFNSSIETSSGSTYILGSGLTVGFRNKNFARGANRLSISATGSLESQIDSSDNPFLQRFYLLTKSIGTNASIEFPKFLVPFVPGQISPRNAPNTVVGVGWNLLERVNYFTLSNTSANITYRWKETETKTWEISPAFVNYIQLPYISDLFQERLNSNEYLKKSYTNVLIEGENIAFTFTDRERKSWKNYNYLKISGEEAGALIGGVSSLLKIPSNYAQYVKFDFDAQRFFNQRHSTVAFRFAGGIGLPYNESTTLPYVKQYFVGGAFSIRGWRIRTLGPGSFSSSAADTGTVTNVIDRTGDIKLEMNGEYRFDIIKLFSGAINMNGAVFADAGNIWLANKSDAFPGGEFRFDKFGSDIAISGGAGLRFDIGGFFVIRIDLATPMRIPDYFGNNSWVLDQIAFGNKEWRRKNLVTNIAIGYPF